MIASPKSAEPGRPAVNFIGPVGARNGLGVSARGYADALVSVAEVNVETWTLGFELVEKISTRYPARPRSAISIIHLNLDLIFGEDLLSKPPLADLFSPHAFNILIPYWELASIKNEWLPILNRFDEVWCASHFMQRAFKAVYRKPVRVIRPLIAHALTEGVQNHTDPECFVFLYAADMGSTLGRKNCGLFWRGYAEEFASGEGAICKLKLHYSQPTDPRLAIFKRWSKNRSDMELIFGSLPPSEMAALQAGSDCYVSPHRSEGLGLTLIEAMLSRKPIIATAYGGPADFISDDTAYPIAFELAEVGEGNEPYPHNFVWAEPDIASLKRQMRQVLSEPGQARAIAEAGRQKAWELFGPGAVSNMREAVQAVCAVQDGMVAGRDRWRG